MLHQYRFYKVSFIAKFVGIKKFVTSIFISLKLTFNRFVLFAWDMSALKRSINRVTDRHFFRFSFDFLKHSYKSTIARFAPANSCVAIPRNF